MGERISEKALGRSLGKAVKTENRRGSYGKDLGRGITSRTRDKGKERNKEEEVGKTN